MAQQLGIVLGYMFISTIVLDLTGYVVHYLQHKVPILWEFHKVHHRREVMHPLSNYREHPVDNFFYLLLIGMGYGAVAGGVYAYAGVVPSVPSVLGVPVLMFLFNIVAYNLRHSHVWLRWPGVWSKVFPLPGAPPCASQLPSGSFRQELCLHAAGLGCDFRHL